MKGDICGILVSPSRPVAGNVLAKQSISRFKEWGSDHHIGRSKNLVVILSSYNPTIACYGSIGRGPYGNQGMIDSIPTTYNFQTFGRHGLPGVDARLPRVFRQPVSDPNVRRNFYVKADTNDAATTIAGRWFDIWAAAVAIDATCVRDGAAGVARVAGGLIVRLDRSYSPPRGNDFVAPNADSSVEPA